MVGKVSKLALQKLADFCYEELKHLSRPYPVAEENLHIITRSICVRQPASCIKRDYKVIKERLLHISEAPPIQEAARPGIGELELE